MSTFVINESPLAMSVQCNEDELIVALRDGRTLSVPLAWFPRLFHATPKARTEFELIGNGEGIHWPALDEDISVIGLLAGRASQVRRNPPKPQS